MIIWSLFWGLFLISLGFLAVVGGIALAITVITGPSKVAEYQEPEPLK